MKFSYEVWKTMFTVCRFSNSQNKKQKKSTTLTNCDIIDKIFFSCQYLGGGSDVQGGSTDLTYFDFSPVDLILCCLFCNLSLEKKYLNCRPTRLICQTNRNPLSVLFSWKIDSITDNSIVYCFQNIISHRSINFEI